MRGKLGFLDLLFLEGITVKIRIPSKKVCEKFLLTYELEGCQKAVNVLTKYHGIGRMKIIVDGRRVGNKDEACYYDNKAYFTKKTLNKSNVLHELYHHIVENYELDMSEKMEERNAKRYIREVLKRGEDF